MLVNGSMLLPPMISVKGRTKPSRLNAGYRGQSLTILTPRQCRTALAGVVGNHNLESGILRARPQRGLPVSRMAHDGHLVDIDHGLGSQVIDDTARPPRPGTDSLPGVGSLQRHSISRK